MTEKINGKIYKLQHKFKPELMYIGSTIMTLSRRFTAHKRHSKILKNTLYNVIKNTGGIKNYSITLIKEVSCNDKEELHKEEQLCIDALKPSLNTINAYTNKHEYKIEYYENNKEEIKKKMSIPITCECGTTIQRWGLSNHRKTKKHKKNYFNYFIKKIEKNLLSKSILKWKSLTN